MIDPLVDEYTRGAPRVSRKLWRRACLWVVRTRNNIFVQTNPRTSGFCAGYLAAMRDVARREKAERRKLSRNHRNQLELFDPPS